MIKKIAVKGYQALYDVEIECGGFTVIYGESDVGKSAFYRAIRAFLTAESGDGFISSGEDIAKVSLELDIGSGVTVTWKKKRGHSCDYNRKSLCGDINWLRCKQMPEEIARDLKIFPIIVDGEKFYPNLHGQFDSLFMLFESSAKRARLLGSLISNILLQGVKEANLERYRNEADIRAFKELLEELEKRSKFDYPTFKGKVTACRVILETVKKIDKSIELISGLLRQIEDLSRYTKLKPVERQENSWFEYLESALNLYAKLSEKVTHIEYETMQLGGINTHIEKCKEEIAYVQEEKQKVAEKLTIECPHCKGKISLLEVQL